MTSPSSEIKEERLRQIEAKLNLKPYLMIHPPGDDVSSTSSTTTLTDVSTLTDDSSGQEAAALRSIVAGIVLNAVSSVLLQL